MKCNVVDAIHVPDISQFQFYKTIRKVISIFRAHSLIEEQLTAMLPTSSQLTYARKFIIICITLTLLTTMYAVGKTPKQTKKEAPA